jgi:hypothetical protein
MELPKTINYWTILSKTTERIGEGAYLYLCQCKCGFSKKCTISAILNGRSKSCGCRKKTCVVLTGKNSDDVPEYNVWMHMKKRCSGKSKNKRDQSYVKRGIKVCERWQKSFAAFYEDMGPRPSPKHSLDRINNDGNYEPENCRWATMKEQGNNTSKTVFLEYNGQKKPMQIWAEELGVNEHSLRDRIFRYGMSIEEAFTRPFKDKELKRFCPKEFSYRGTLYTIEEVCEKFGLEKKDIISRFHKKWSVERIIETPINRKETKPIRELTFNGQTLSVDEWSNKTGISAAQIRARIIRNWTLERALTQPMRGKRK